MQLMWTKTPKLIKILLWTGNRIKSTSLGGHIDIVSFRGESKEIMNPTLQGFQDFFQIIFMKFKNSEILCLETPSNFLL